jgi:hypothetical protein
MERRDRSVYYPKSWPWKKKKKKEEEEEEEGKK